MNFFEHQDQAESRTLQMSALFVLCIAGTCAGMMGVTWFLWGFARNGGWQRAYSHDEITGVALVGIFTLAVILISSACKAISLGRNGDAVMRSLGAFPVPLSPSSEDLIRLRNVTEEMALASGIPVPQLYVMEKQHINACAAGLDPSQAAIAVTRGCLEQLDRDELQGVIAHEFSHILHGDMRLNTRLISWLFGLLVLRVIGRSILEHLDALDSVRGAIVIAVVGGTIMTVGVIGHFFGSLLQCMISRQREFLADASAVQFTRNPDGIVNALRKIGGAPRTGRSFAARDDLAHMMFNSSGSRLSFSTHPPLRERISRLNPSWEGTFIPLPLKRTEPRKSPTPPKARKQAQNPVLTALGLPLAGHNAETWGHAWIGLIGLPTAALLDRSHHWLKSVPEDLLTAARDSGQASALVLDLLRSQSFSGPFEHSLHRMQAEDHVPLLELCLPALRQLPPHEQQELVAEAEGLINADGKVDLKEYTLLKVLENSLPALSQARTRPIQLSVVWDEISLLLNAVSCLDAETDAAARTNFEAAVATLPPLYSKRLRFTPLEDDFLPSFHAATERLVDLPPVSRKNLLKACLASVTADGRFSPTEVQSFRALSAMFRLPIPPYLVLPSAIPEPEAE